MSAKEYPRLLHSESAATDHTTGRYRPQEPDMVLATRQARVLICDPIATAAVARLRDSGLQVDERIGLSAAALETLIGKYDAIVVRSATRLTAGQIAAANRLRLIVRGGIGTDNIDLDAARKRHIPVFNTPDASTVSVAELALGQLLALARRTPQADAALKAGTWPKQAFADGIELKGKTLGIIGVGRIGGTLGRYASALGMRIIGTDASATPAGRFDGLELVTLEALLARADCISVHTPSLGGQAAIGRHEMAQMKDGALLINCARGGLVDEEALLEALESGKIRGAALDVFSEEPPRDQRLIHHPAVICTPHLGGATCEAQARIGMEIVQILQEKL